MIYLKDGNIPLNLAYDDDIVQEANSTYQLSFKFPLTDGKWNLLKREVFLLADDLHGEQEFFIFEVKKVNGHVQVYAKQVATLLNYYSINSISVDRVPGQTVMTALAGSVKRPCPFSFFSDILDRHTFNESNASVMDALTKDKHSIVGQWGGDLVRDKYQVKLLKNGGIENESLFMYKKNLSSYEESENINNLKTRLHLKKTIQGQSEGEADRVIAVTVDSPLIGQYRQIYEADIEVNDQDVTDVASLTAYGKRYFSSTLCDLVENSINLDVKGKSDVSVKMFDTVSVFHEQFDVDLRLKITSYHFGPMSKRLKSIGFGKVSQTFGSTVASMVAGSVDKATGRLSASFEQKLQKEIDNANRHFDAEFDKRVEVINNSIEQSRAEAERHADQIKTEISQEFGAFEQEYQVTKQSQSQQIADILAKAQANTILATDAKNIGNQAKADAANVLSKALQYKNEAIAEATRLDTVERQATETKLATAKSQAISEATRLVETAKSLLSGQISNVSTDLSQTKEAIKLLATKATVDTLTGRVSSAEAMIQVQADQISQRVKTSDFDQAKQRISMAESSIIQIGNRITTEISETVAKIPQNISHRNLATGSSENWSRFINFTNSVNARYQLGTFAYKDYNTGLYPGTRVNLYVLISVDNVVLDSNISNKYIKLQSFRRTNGTDFWDNQPFYNKWSTPLKAGNNYHMINVSDVISNVQAEADTFTLELRVDGAASCDIHHRAMTVTIGDLKPTYWVKPIDDLITDVTTVRTSITQTASGVEQLSTKLTETAGKVTSAETNIRQLVNDVASKVSQTTFDNLKKTVDSQGTAITQNQSAIALKAEKTFVDNVKSTADSALTKANSNANQISTTRAELQVTSQAIETKASKTDVNNLTGRLTNAETSIRTQAGQIEQRLTSTQVEQAIASKGYQTKSDVDSNISSRGYATNTSVENLVRTTSESFTQRISETRSLIPTESSGNLLLDSGKGWSNVHDKTYILAEDLIIGRIYTITSHYRHTNGATGHTFNIGDNVWRSLSYDNTVDSWVCTFTVSTNVAKGTEIRIGSHPSAGLGSSSWVTLTKGKIPMSVWQPAQSELTSVVAFNEVKDTVRSHTQIISEQGQSISQVIQTAQGIVSRVSSLVDTQNIVYDPTNYSKYVQRESNSNLTLIDTTEYKLLRITQSGLTANSWKGFKMPLHSQKFVKGEKLSYRVSLWVDVLPDAKVGFEIKAGSAIAGFSVNPNKIGGNQIFTGTFSVTKTVTTTDDFGLHVWLERNGTVAVGQISIVRGDQPPTSFIDNTSALQLATQTQVNTLAGSWSVQNLNSSGDILSQANLSSAQFLLEAAKIRLKGKTLADEIQAIDGKFGTLFVADGTFAKLNANVIDSQAITADKLKVDQAFFTKFMANDAYLKQLFTKSAFITQVQAVTMSASQISGGILTATNGAMQVNLNAGQIMYYTDQAALKRVLTGYPTQFVKFATGTVSGKGNAGVTVIGSNRWNSESSNDGGFVGIRAWNGTDIDQIDVVGDTVRLASSAFEAADGWSINTLPGKLDIDAFNADHRASSKIKVGDLWLWKNASTYSSMKETINLIIDNLQLLHSNKSTERAYSYTLPAKV